MTYSLPYVLLLIFFALLAVVYAQRNESEKDKILCAAISFVAVGVFYIFFAFRGYVYTDWRNYAELYESVEWSDIFSIVNPKKESVIHEPGFTLLMCLCRLVSDEYAFLVIVITTIDTVLFLRFLKHWEVKNIPFAFMLFVMFHGVGIMFNALRNQISIFIFINLLEYIENKQALKYFAGCVLALCFHTTSILFFPLYFILCHKLNRWTYLGIFLFCFVFYLSHISIVMTLINLLGLQGALGAKAEMYTEHFSDARLFSITGTIEKFGLVGLIFYFYDSLTKTKKNIILINCFLLSIFFYYIFSEFSVLSQRLSMLFEFSYWIIWIVIADLFTVKNNKRIYCGLLFLYCCYSQAVGYPTPAQRYDNLLFGADSQEQRLQIVNKTYEGI